MTSATPDAEREAIKNLHATLPKPYAELSRLQKIGYFFGKRYTQPNPQWVMKRSLEILADKLVAPGEVIPDNFRSYKPGDTITISKPPRYLGKSS